jgi:hypothetical protein
MRVVDVKKKWLAKGIRAGAVFVVLGTGGAVTGLSARTVAPAIAHDSPSSVLPSAYANFLVGRFAMTQGDVATAQRSLSLAASRDPANTDLREKAFLVTVLNGDIDTAAAMSTQLKAAIPTTQMMAELVNTVVAVKSGKSAEAQKHLEALFKLKPDDRSGILLKP